MQFEMLSKKLDKKYTVYINAKSISIYDNGEEVITTENDIGMSDIINILKQYEQEVKI
jgi:NAD dependent epimerase/dehydratase family enzyme